MSFEGSETRKMILRARCRDMLRNATKVAALIVAATNFAHAETADVKYRGRVDLKPFTCTDITRSSFIEGVCYDKVQSYMLINLSGTFYHYCELPAPTFDAFMIAPSMGKFYNQNIRGSGSDGPYDCRTHNVPSYR
ncbi:KTSC domain-containing protein [Bradyrhizobium sp. 173]|uniref:KTSC domain-containing protein n=1 Tax=Bradyrhizobium sp. 173 TaxID=2782644 RepID=UPI001FF78D8A